MIEIIKASLRIQKLGLKAVPSFYLSDLIRDREAKYMKTVCVCCRGD